MNPTEFLFAVRVYYEDTDVSGVVYHANYLRWFERARTEWLRGRGYSQEALMQGQGIAFTVAGMEIDWIRPARLDDELEVVTVVAETRRASINFGQTLRRRGADPTVLCRARVRVACVDAKSFKPRAMPPL